MVDEKRFAVLIDSDNISFRYIKYILDEVSNYGSVTYKRIYGDFTNTTAGGWKNILLENSDPADPAVQLYHRQELHRSAR